MIRKTDAPSIAPYLRDASNYSQGKASEVIIPENQEELVDFLKQNTNPITISGAGTGLTASRIPLTGSIISLEKFNKIGTLNNGTIASGVAVTLKELSERLKGSNWFYPPNPTEWLASIGGTLATNASGSRSYKYGSTRDYVLELEVVLSDGRTTRVSRGETINQPLYFDDGSKINFPLIRYESPKCKNAAGYYIRKEMDWIDLFLGSDGTLGFFTEVKLKLLPSPNKFLSAILFFENEVDSWDLVEKIKYCNIEKISPCSLEYFDQFSLKRLKDKFSGIPTFANAALFFEQDVQHSDEYDDYLDIWYEFLDREKVQLEDSWFAETSKDLEKFHDFRHQVPLMINEENSRLGRVKIGTDMALEDKYFKKMMSFYNEILMKSNLDYVIFGHIGDNHLHINLLPRKDQMDTVQKTYDSMVDQILNWGGTVSAEHGIGKLKKRYYHKMVGEDALNELRSIKKLFDCENKLGIGNLL